MILLWEDNYLAHFGIKGQKWGIRRFQNEDGTLTEAGKKRYGSTEAEFKNYLKVQKDKANKLQAIERKRKEVYVKKQNRYLEINPFQPEHAGRRWAKAQKKLNKQQEKVDKIQEIYDRLPKDAPIASLTGMNKKTGENFGKQLEKMGIAFEGTKREGIFKQIKNRMEAMVYPPELVGKSKEEKKAWEEAENKKFEASIKKDKADRDFGKKLDKFDKLSIDDKTKVREEVDSRIKELKKKEANEGLTHDERKELDGLSDWASQDLVELAKKSVYHKDVSSEINAVNMTAAKKQLENHPAVKEAAKAGSEAFKKYQEVEKELQKVTEEFYKNKELYEKYLNKAVDYAMKEDWAQNWGGRQNIYDWFKYDDGDQGDRSSFELYKKSPEGKRIAEIEKRQRELYKNFSDECKRSISKAVGSYGEQETAPGHFSVQKILAWNAIMLAEKDVKRDWG